MANGGGGHPSGTATSRRPTSVEVAETSQTPAHTLEIVEHPFANIRLVAPEDVDGMSRSLAIGGSLTRADTERLLDACATPARRAAAIARILDELGPSWTGARRALNELARRIVNAGNGLSRPRPVEPRSIAGTCAASRRILARLRAQPWSAPRRRR